MNEEIKEITPNNISKNIVSKKRGHNFFVSAFIITSGMLTVKILGAAFKIPLMSLLGGEGTGYFVNAYNLYNPIYALSTAGLPIAISRLVSKNVTLGRFKNVKRIKRVTGPIFLITGSVGFVLIILGSFLYIRLAKSPGSLYSIFMLAPTLLFSCLISTYRGYYEGLHQMIPTAMSEVIESAGKLIFGLTFVFLLNKYAISEFNNYGKVFNNLIPYFSNLKTVDEVKTALLPFSSAAAILGVAVSALSSFIFVFLYDKIIGDKITNSEVLFSPPADSNKKIFNSILKISIPVALGALIMNVAGVIDSILIQQRLAGYSFVKLNSLLLFYKNLIPEDIIARNVVHIFLMGCYGYTYTIIMFLPTIAGGIAISALPTVTSSWVSGDKQNLSKNIRMIIKLVSIISLPMGIGISFMSLPIIDLLFPNIELIEKTIASSIIMISGIAAIFISLSTPLCSILQAVGRADLPVKILSIGMIIKIILNFILVDIPQINIQGAGIGTLVCYIFIFLICVKEILKITKVKLNLFSVFLKITICSLICSFSAYVLYSFLTNKINLNLKISTLLSIIFSVIVYLITILKFKVLNYDDIVALTKNKKLAKKLGFVYQ